MIKLFDYQRALTELEGELTQAFQRVLHSGQLILGPETFNFEEEFAAWCGARYCVAVTSGTAALYLSLKALDLQPGDEVITVSNTCPPTISAICMAGCIPVFVDVEPTTLMMDVGLAESAITSRTRCILPVHLWGNSVNLDALTALGKRYNLHIIEDCAQATGTQFGEQQVGTFGRMGCFSFYPTKNLGCYGDGGAIITNDGQLARHLRMLRMYGYDGEPVSLVEGANARISEMQAAFLRIKLKRLDEDLSRRCSTANQYKSVLSECHFPATSEHTKHTYHQFVIWPPSRAEFSALLNQAGIQWAIHYKVPTHLMPAFKKYGKSLPVTEVASENIMSVPVHENLTDDETHSILEVLKCL
jgi:aminotransferase EvaB